MHFSLGAQGFSDLVNRVRGAGGGNAAANERRLTACISYCEKLILAIHGGLTDELAPSQIAALLTRHNENHAGDEDQELPLRGEEADAADDLGRREEDQRGEEEEGRVNDDV